MGCRMWTLEGLLEYEVELLKRALGGDEEARAELLGGDQE